MSSTSTMSRSDERPMTISRLGRSGNSPPWYFPEMKRSVHMRCVRVAPSPRVGDDIAGPKGAQNLTILRLSRLASTGHAEIRPAAAASDGARRISIDDRRPPRRRPAAPNGPSAARCGGPRRARCWPAAPASRGPRRSTRPRPPAGRGRSHSSRRKGLPGSSCRLASPSGAVSRPNSADQVPWRGVPSMTSRRTRCRPPSRLR